jgi:MFS family permease
LKTTGGKGAVATVALVATLVAIYSISQFFRNSIGVIGPNLAREFDLDAASLGFLGAIFYFSFALMQIPLGMAIDRYGPKASIVFTAIIAVIGTVVFALARDFAMLAGGRLIIGAGCSSFFMGALAIYAVRFPPEKFAVMTGIQLGAGTLGSLAATAPLAAASERYGWRASFLAIGALCAVLTVLVVLLVREEGGDRARRLARRETLGDLLRGVVAAARVPGFWGVFLMQATTYSAFATIVGLWGGPWLSQVFGMSLDERGRALFAMVLAQVIGLFLWGGADRLFRGYRIPGMIGVVGGVCMLAIAAIAPPSRDWLVSFLVVYAVFFAVTPILTAHGRALFPQPLIGRGLTLLNIGNMGGVFLQQMITGLVIEGFGARIVDGVRVYPEAGYRAVFAVLAVEMGVAVVLYARAADPHPSKIA